MSIEKLRLEIDRNAAELEAIDEAIAASTQRIQEMQDAEEAIRQLQSEHINDSDKFGKIGVELSTAREKRTQEEQRKKYILKQQLELITKEISLNQQLADQELFEFLEDLEKSIPKLKGAWTRAIKQTLELLDGCKAIRDFKQRAPSYNDDLLVYYEPSLQVQNTIIALLKTSGLISVQAANMTNSQAKPWADVSNMIRSPKQMLEYLKNPEDFRPFDETPTEWMEATDKDFSEVEDV